VGTAIYVGHVKHYVRTPLHALVEERHFALQVGLRFSNLGLAFNRLGQELSPTRPSLRSLTAIKIRLFELPHLLGAGCPIVPQINRFLVTAASRAALSGLRTLNSP
jgi:hypothetical protein